MLKSMILHGTFCYRRHFYHGGQVVTGDVLWMMKIGKWGKMVREEAFYEGAFHEKFPYEDVTMKGRFAYAYSYICVYMRIYAYICVYMAICGPNHLVIPLPSLFLYHLLFKTMTRVVHHYLNVVWTALIWMSTVLCIHRTILYWVKSAKNLRWFGSTPMTAHPLQSSPFCIQQRWDREKFLTSNAVIWPKHTGRGSNSPI